MALTLVLVLHACVAAAQVQSAPAAGEVPGAPTLPRVSLGTDQLPYEVGRGPRLGPYYLIRSEDSLASLRTPARAPDVFDALKDLPLRADGLVFLTLSYEQRARFEDFSTTLLGMVKAGRQSLLSFREGLGADLHLGTHLRVFASLQSGQVGGEIYAKPPPPNRDDLALLQAFAEATTRQDGATVGLRAGRQQMVLGNGLLFAVRDNTNIQQTYDGVRGYFDTARLRIDAFYLDNVANRTGVFNDGANAHQVYWGTYGSVAIPWVAGVFVDPFYVGNYRRRAFFDGVVGSEARSSFGARLWGSVVAADLDVTAVAQNGTQAGHGVGAFAVFSALGYSFANMAMQPRLGMHIDVGSGGRQPGGAVHTYDPLNFSGIYVSEVPLLSPSNLVKLGVGLSASPLPSVRVQVIGAAYWRTVRDDFLYNFAGLPFPRSNLAHGVFVGLQPALRAAWAVDRHWTVVGQAAELEVSRALRGVGARRETYLSSFVLFRF